MPLFGANAPKNWGDRLSLIGGGLYDAGSALQGQSSNRLAGVEAGFKQRAQDEAQQAAIGGINQEMGFTPRTPTSNSLDAQPDIYGALARAAQAGVDISPYLKLHQAQNPAPERPQFEKVGDTLLKIQGGEVSPAYTAPQQAATPRIFQGPYGLYQVGEDGKVVELKNWTPPAIVTKGMNPPKRGGSSGGGTNAEPPE